MKTEIDRDKFVRVGEILSYLQTDCYLKKAEASKYLGIGIRTLESWLDRIPHYRPGGKTLFRKSELDQFMASHRELATAVDASPARAVANLPPATGPIREIVFKQIVEEECRALGLQYVHVAQALIGHSARL
jgi:excisionase family DNA binding protein